MPFTDYSRQNKKSSVPLYQPHQKTFGTLQYFHLPQRVVKKTFAIHDDRLQLDMEEEQL
jgi:hypothetical protein